MKRLLAFTLSLALCGPAQCAILFVSPPGTSEPEPPYGTPETAAGSIQIALDYAAAHDIVFVLPGRYEEKVRTEKPISLLGEGRELCLLANPDGPPPFADDTLVVRADATVMGLTISGGRRGVVLDAPQPLLADCRISDAYYGVECRSGFPTILRCHILNNGCSGITADGLASPAILDCLIAGNEATGISCNSGDSGAIPVISGCIIRENGGGIIVEGPWATVDRSLIVFNGYAIRLGMDYECAGSVSRSTMALNGHWGLAMVDRGVLLDRCIVWSPPFGAIEGYVRPENITRTMASLVRPTYSDEPFESRGLLLTHNPGFVGWGSFNNTDNPIHVDASAGPAGDGTKERPFRCIRDAFYSFDFRLAADSPAVSAFGHGGHGVMLQPIGYYADQPLAEESGSLAVTIEVAPGTYIEPGLTLPPGCNVLGKGSSRPVLRAGLSLWEGTLRHVTFDGGGAYSAEGTVADCQFIRAKLGLGGADAVRCAFTGEDAMLWIGGSGSVVRDCLFHAIPYTALDVHPDMPDTRVVSCTFYDCRPAINAKDWGSLPPTVVNSVFWQNGPDFESRVAVPVSHSLVPGGYPGEGNVDADPMFVGADNGDFRLLPSSPCIDAGDNSAPNLPDADIAGMHRIMFGGKSLTVDMGAYEFYVNRIEPIPGRAVLTWSSLEAKTYSIFYTEDLFTWHLAIDNFPSFGNTTTSWLDDGTLTGIPPCLVPKRFYRLLENPSR
jgi:hypothetical protein